MGRYIGIIASFCILWSVAAEGQALIRSKISFTASRCELGTIREQDGNVSRSFEFTNTGNAPLVIISARTDCGCLTPEYPKRPIMPGGKGTIRITFNPAGRPGPFRRDIAIISNNGDDSDLLSISGTVVPIGAGADYGYPLKVGGGLCLDRTALYFGYLGQGSRKELSAEYRNTSSKEVSLSVEIPGNPGIFIVEAPAKIPAQGTGRITVTCDLTRQNGWGRLNAELSLRVNGIPSQQTMLLSGVGTDNFARDAKQQPAPKAEFDIPYYSLGDVRAGESKTAVILLSNKGQRALEVRAVQSAEGVTCSLAPGTVIKPGGSIKITASMLFPKDASGLAARSIWITLNDPAQPLQELRLSGNVKP